MDQTTMIALGVLGGIVLIAVVVVIAVVAVTVTSAFHTIKDEEIGS
jgi:hypothetical protein